MTYPGENRIGLGSSQDDKEFIMSQFSRTKDKEHRRM